MVWVWVRVRARVRVRTLGELRAVGRCVISLGGDRTDWDDEYRLSEGCCRLQLWGVYPSICILLFTIEVDWDYFMTRGRWRRGAEEAAQLVTLRRAESEGWSGADLLVLWWWQGCSWQKVGAREGGESSWSS